MILREEEKEFLQELVEVSTLPTPAYDFSISRNVKQVWDVPLGGFKY